MPPEQNQEITKNSWRSAILKKHGIKNASDALHRISWEPMHAETKQALDLLFEGRSQLRKRYVTHLTERGKHNSEHRMTFELDGRLVGDIGELVAAEIFQLDLLGTKSKDVDAETEVGPKRRVQVKATFQEQGLSVKHEGDYFIGIQLNNSGQFRIIYNGPAKPALEYLRLPKAKGHAGRAETGSKLQAIPIEMWALLDLDVAPADRIPRRKLATDS